MTRSPRLRETPALPRGFDPIGAPLGAGTNAVVWPARRTVDGRVFAVKVWRGRFHHAGDRQNFLAEVRLHAGLSRQSGHLVSYAWAEVDAVPPWIALEPRGASLESHLTAGPPPLATGLVWAVDLLAGLAVLHDAGLLHRDVKPSNVLVDHGRAAVCDFGLVVEAETPTDDDLAGTPRWTAPEILHDGARPSRRSDVYSAAVVVRELLGDDLPAEIEQLVTAASSVRPSDRPPGAGEFGARLRSATENAGILLPPPLHGRRPGDTLDDGAGRTPRSRRRKVLAWSTVVVALISTLAASGSFSAQDPPPAATAPAAVRPDGTVVVRSSGLQGFCEDKIDAPQMRTAHELRDADDVLVGSIEVFWSATESRGCARLLKPLASDEEGFPTPLALTLCGSGGACGDDAGDFRRYAGPVLVPSPQDCLSWRGSIADEDGNWLLLNEVGTAGCSSTT